LANAQSWDLQINAGMFTPDEARLQTIQDGLVTISIPEKMPEAERAKLLAAKQLPVGANEVGNPVKPSSGGQGEIKAQQIVTRGLEEDDVNDAQAQEIIRQNDRILERLAIYTSQSQIQPQAAPNINVNFDQLRFDNLNIPPAQIQVTNEIQVNPTPVEITNEVTSPDVVVNVDAPQVDVINQVQPTPVEIINQVPVPDVTINSPVEVNLKQSEKITSTVYRDAQGRIAEVVTENETDVGSDE
jgi:hypothetical protein